MSGQYAVGSRQLVVGSVQLAIIDHTEVNQ
ncbi:MAG: hypothetical protein JWP94_1575 [Mucilaginibacter sp.]|nr:hypothetical protein [Mucilaginibacter sp.]